MGGGGATYDYGFRIYNPQIAKFLSVDPLTMSYPWYTPYQFAGNKPTWAIDMDGLEELRETKEGGFEVHFQRDGASPTAPPPLIVKKPTPKQTVVTSNQTIVKAGVESAPEVRQALVRRAEYNASREEYLKTGRSLDPFSFGGTDGNPNGFISTFGTALKETPGVVLPELAFAKLSHLYKARVLAKALEAEARSIASVATPYGEALQAAAPEAMAARAQVESGAKMYRIGTLNRSQAGEAQFWALEHPLENPQAFAKKYGIPVENIQNADFIEIGTIRPGTQFITRPAPPAPTSGAGSGGGIEVVTPSNGVQLETFHVIKR